MRRELEPLCPDLCWEFGPGQSHGAHSLAILSDEDPALQPLVDRIVERAPVLAGWTWQRYRPCLADLDECGFDALEHSLLKGSLKAASVAPRSTPDGRIALDFAFPDGPRTRWRAKVQAAVLCQAHLGGECVRHWVGAITATGRPWWGKRRDEAHGGVPLADLLSTVERLIEDARARMPARPLWSNSEEPEPQRKGVRRAGNHTARPLDVWERSRPYADFDGGDHSYLEVLNAALGAGFSSRRFGRFGELFAFLRVDGRGPWGGAGGRRALEREVDRVLRPDEVGACLGSGTGALDTYIEVVLRDPDVAAERLRGMGADLGLPRRAWLQFHDAELGAEWVGLTDDDFPPHECKRGW